ncbi:MAG: ATP-binding protein [bacterium]|nr:ATP-binding protein [bacterium]
MPRETSSRVDQESANGLVGRRQELEILFKEVYLNPNIRFVNIAGTPDIGKSSLLRMVEGVCQRQRAPYPQIPCATVDFALPDSPTTPEELKEYLGKQLLAGLFSGRPIMTRICGLAISVAAPEERAAIFGEVSGLLKQRPVIILDSTERLDLPTRTAIKTLLVDPAIDLSFIDEQPPIFIWASPITDHNTDHLAIRMRALEIPLGPLSLEETQAQVGQSLAQRVYQSSGGYPRANQALKEALSADFSLDDQRLAEIAYRTARNFALGGVDDEIIRRLRILACLPPQDWNRLQENWSCFFPHEQRTGDKLLNLIDSFGSWCSFEDREGGLSVLEPIRTILANAAKAGIN